MKRIALAAGIAATLLSACGGGGSGTTTPVNPQPSNATVQINLGDDPADRLLAVGVTMNSLSLTNASGGSVSVLTAPRPMEMMQSMGTVFPLAVASVPQGTYTGATMTFGGATVTYVDPTSGQLVQKNASGPMTSSVQFNPPMTIGTAPMVINFDMNMANSVAIDAAGNVSMTPAMSVHPNPVNAGSVDPEDGGMHGLIGMVSSLSGNAFGMSLTQGITGMSLATNSITQFVGMTGMGMMSGNMLVSVDATLQPDGTWMATRVQSRMGAGGAMAAGLVTSLTGNPPTQLVIVMQNGVGNGMLASNLAGTSTVNIDSSTQFSIDSAGIDLGNLPFTPRFDRTTLSKGQRVEAFSSGQMMQGGGMGGMMGGATLAATSVLLDEQGLRGVVSNYSPSGTQASFTLTLAADSAFGKLTGASSVTVYRQGGTELRGLTSIANGTTVQVRGLLFFDGGVYRLVAGRIVGS